MAGSVSSWKEMTLFYECAPMESKIKSFRDEVSNIHKDSDYSFECICSMDETPVYLDLVPNKVADKKGKRKHPSTYYQLWKKLYHSNSVLHCSWKFPNSICSFQRENSKTIEEGGNSIRCGYHYTSKRLDEVRMLEWIKCGHHIYQASQHCWHSTGFWPFNK